MPAFLNVYLDESVYAQFGVQPGILVSADINGTDVMDQLNTFDFAGAIGLGFDIDNFLLSARYNIGFTSTSKQASGSFPNMVFQVSAGIKFSSAK